MLARSTAIYMGQSSNAMKLIRAATDHKKKKKMQSRARSMRAVHFENPIS